MELNKCWYWVNKHIVNNLLRMVLNLLHPVILKQNCHKQAISWLILLFFS